MRRASVSGPRRARPWLGLACVVIAFIAAMALRSPQADPRSRLPARYRLADLIQQEQASAAALRGEVAELRRAVEEERALSARRRGAVPARDDELETAGLLAGLTAVRGPGVRVTLDDSSLDAPPAGATVNDLVVHSQDVQAVVNALWRAGAEAVSINGQRLVSTSAVLCVGNTLLLNGTVHSPPYVVSAVGAGRDRFEGDRLVRRLRTSVESFQLRLAVDGEDDLEVPAYRGPTKMAYARPH